MSDTTNGNGSTGKYDFWVRFIRDIGFPIAVALFLLSQIPPLREAVSKLNDTMSVMSQVLSEQTKELRQHRMMSEHYDDRRYPPNSSS